MLDYIFPCLAKSWGDSLLTCPSFSASWRCRDDSACRSPSWVRSSSHSKRSISMFFLFQSPLCVVPRQRTMQPRDSMVCHASLEDSLLTAHLVSGAAPSSSILAISFHHGMKRNGRGCTVVGANSFPIHGGTSAHRRQFSA